MRLRHLRLSKNLAVQIYFICFRSIVDGLIKVIINRHCQNKLKIFCFVFFVQINLREEHITLRRKQNALLGIHSNVF